MPELITVQVGQCGIQLGTRFWDLALREHAAHARTQAAGSAAAAAAPPPRLPAFDDSLASFFRNVDTSQNPPLELQPGQIDPNTQVPHRIHTLKARAVLIDMEEGVLRSVMKGPLADLFDWNQFIRDVSGSGNNWAHGHEVYGPRYEEHILESLRAAAEPCNSLQSFFLMHSLGGGTGSGLGTYTLQLLADEFPGVYRFTTGIFPSADDDVITSPYNAVLAMHRLIEHADCVLPVENQALHDIVERITPNKHQDKGRAPGQYNTQQQRRGASLIDDHDHKHFQTGEAGGSSSSHGKRTKAAGAGAAAGKRGSEGAKPFDDMNTVAAHVLTNLTCSMRFPGTLNVDLNEITMNLVPYPRLHFLLSSVSPLYSLADVKHRSAPRTLNQMFTDALSADCQLIRADPRRSTYLACGLIVRGRGVQISDVNRNIERLKPSMRLIHWNADGFKVGLCSVPPVGQPQSLLCLSNNCCVAETFRTMRGRFMRLYGARAHLHHYTEYADASIFPEALHALDELTADYGALNTARAPLGDAGAARSQRIPVV